MKRIIFVCCVLLIGLDSFSQQVPLYSLYHHNQFIYNPARTGFNGSPEAYVMYRKQWLDFNGAPETRAISFDMPVKNAGLGAYVYNDIADIFNRWGGYLSYAYHVPFKNEKHRFSIGLAAGIQEYRIDADKINVKDSDDPLLLNGLERGTSFDGSAGVHYFVTSGTKTKVKKSKSVVADSTGSAADSFAVATTTESTERTSKSSLLNLSLGLSAVSVYGTDLKFLNDNTESTYYRVFRHYVASLSNKFKLAQEKFILEPMVLARLTEALNYQIDAGLLIGYKDWVWVSGAYRFDYGVTIGGGFKVHDAVKVGYSYDMALNNISDYTSGTHELMLGITFGGRKDKETKRELERLSEQLAIQDSLFKQMQAEQDSLSLAVDSLTSKVDSLNKMLEAGLVLEEGYEDYGDLDSEMLADIKNLSEDEWKEKYGEEEYDKYKLGSEGEAEYSRRTQQLEDKIDRLESEIGDLQRQIQETMSQLEIKVKDVQNEMTEERTRIVSEEDLEYKRGVKTGDYFLVVGSFRIEDNSYRFQEDLTKRNYEAGVVYDKKRKWYYVYIAQPSDLKKGLEDLYKLREENPEFHDAWIHIMSNTLK